MTTEVRRGDRIKSGSLDAEITDFSVDLGGDATVTIAVAYAGSAITSAAYEIQPTSGFQARLAQALNALVPIYEGAALGPLSGNFEDLAVTGSLTLPAGGITRAALANSTALSVIGRSANSEGAPSDIVADTDGHVLRRNGTTLAFGQLSSNALPDQMIGLAKLANGAALSVIGRSANSTGIRDDIAAGTDGHVLRRSGTTLGFGVLASGAFGDNTIAPGRLTNFAALSVLGRGANSEGAAATIAAGSDHQVLRRSGSTIGFGALALNQSNAVTGLLPAANVAVHPALRVTCGGTANAVTLTTGAGISGTPPTGLQLRFRASAANTGATTIALDGGSAIACRTVTGVALPSGYIRTNAETVATFDGTFWVLNRAEERGSNANGSFTRFETGLMLCEQTFTGINVDAALGQIFRSSVLTSWTYPAAFLAEPVIGGNAGDTGAWIGVGTSGTSIAYLRFCGGVTLTGISPRLTATGPWY